MDKTFEPVVSQRLYALLNAQESYGSSLLFCNLVKTIFKETPSLQQYVIKNDMFYTAVGKADVKVKNNIKYATVTISMEPIEAISWFSCTKECNTAKLPRIGAYTCTYKFKNIEEIKKTTAICNLALTNAFTLPRPAIEPDDYSQCQDWLEEFRDIYYRRQTSNIRTPSVLNAVARELLQRVYVKRMLISESLLHVTLYFVQDKEGYYGVSKIVSSLDTVLRLQVAQNSHDLLASLSSN